MAEGGGLLNRYTLQRRIEGSNPSVSARLQMEVGCRITIRAIPQKINARGCYRAGAPTKADAVGTAVEQGWLFNPPKVAPRIAT